MAFALLLIAACRQAEPAATPATEGQGNGTVAVYAGEGRDRLCLADNGGAAGFVTYAPGSDANCTLRGSWSSAAPPTIRPNGDGACTMTVRQDGRSVTLGAGGPGCAYYCAPGATFAGRTFVRMDAPAPATDLAGDPLC